MRTLRVIALPVAIAFLVWLALFTSSKLYKMTAIRGWVSGATYKEHLVTDKRRSDGEYGPVYWIAWGAADITRRSSSRENLDETQWHGIKVGDSVRIAYYRDEPDPYKPDGVYASTGNFVFDLLLLGVEILFISALVRRLVRQQAKALNHSLNPDAQERRAG